MQDNIAMLQKHIDELIDYHHQMMLTIKQQEYLNAAGYKDKISNLLTLAKQFLNDLINDNWQYTMMIHPTLMRPHNTVRTKDIVAAKFIIQQLGIPQAILFHKDLDGAYDFSTWILINAIKNETTLPNIDLLESDENNELFILFQKFKSRDSLIK